MTTTSASTDVLEMVLTERDDTHAIYEAWVRISSETHGFYRYTFATRACERIDVARPTACELSVATRVGQQITRAIDELGELPERIARRYW